MSHITAEKISELIHDLPEPSDVHRADELRAKILRTRLIEAFLLNFPVVSTVLLASSFQAVFHNLNEKQYGDAGISSLVFIVMLWCAVWSAIPVVCSEQEVRSLTNQMKDLGNAAEYSLIYYKNL